MEQTLGWDSRETLEEMIGKSLCYGQTAASVIIQIQNYCVSAAIHTGDKDAPCPDSFT